MLKSFPSRAASLQQDLGLVEPQQNERLFSFTWTSAIRIPKSLASGPEQTAPRGSKGSVADIMCFPAWHTSGVARAVPWRVGQGWRTRLSWTEQHLARVRRWLDLENGADVTRCSGWHAQTLLAAKEPFPSPARGWVLLTCGICPPLCEQVPVWLSTWGQFFKVCAGPAGWAPWRI